MLVVRQVSIHSRRELQDNRQMYLRCRHVHTSLQVDYVLILWNKVDRLSSFDMLVEPGRF